ncbi:MAG TPA: hypothetical protein VGG19_11375 [Tepidisphaeraceae bacterium]|jgi:hypothetical protein
MRRAETTLRVYADIGLRSVEGWAECSREIREDAKPRTTTLHEGETIPLFSRDQTRQKSGKKKLSPVADVPVKTVITSQPI